MDGFYVNFHSGVDINRNGDIICSSYMHDNLFYLKPISSSLHSVEQSNSWKRKVSSSYNTYLWHFALRTY